MQVDINYIAVIAAAAANMVLGFLWYGPIFGAPWKRLMGFSNADMRAMKMTPLQAMVGGAIGALVMAYVLAHSLVFASAYTATVGIAAGLMTGFWNWLGFAVPITIGIVLWEDRPWRLWLLNSGYWLVSLLAMGVILALWPR